MNPNDIIYTPRQKVAQTLLICIGCLAAVTLFLQGPIPQDPTYHSFADQRIWFNIPNFWNVFSNLLFIFVGIVGLRKCKEETGLKAKTDQTALFRYFFCGVLVTGLGSAYYHLQPNNWGLFWDRLAMAVTFAAFFSIIISCYVDRKTGNRFFVPFLLFGLSSVIYWIVTEQLGTGDLRLYAVTQFLPILVIPLIVLFRKSESIEAFDIIIIGTGYGLAKICEAYDIQIFQTIFLSGHSLKHLAAACSAYWVLIVVHKTQLAGH